MSRVLGVRGHECWAALDATPVRCVCGEPLAANPGSGGDALYDALWDHIDAVQGGLGAADGDGEAWREFYPEDEA